VSATLCVPILALAFALGIDFRTGLLGVVSFVAIPARGHAVAHPEWVALGRPGTAALALALVFLLSFTLCFAALRSRINPALT